MGGVRAVSAAGLAAVAALGCLGLTACTGDPPSDPPAPTGTQRQSDRERLAGLAAAAKDKRYVATYTWSVPDQPDRTVTVAVGTDDSWVVSIPASGLSGLADLAMFSDGHSRYQCTLGPATGTAGLRPDLQITPGCVKIGKLSSHHDPRVWHLFTDWIDPLVDRATALSVAATDPLPGAHGECYSVESNSAALAPPVDPGVYCYADGVLTAVKVSFGSLVLAGEVAAAPPSVALPAPIVSRTPQPLTAPPPPPPPPSATPTAS